MPEWLVDPLILLALGGVVVVVAWIARRSGAPAGPASADYTDQPAYSFSDDAAVGPDSGHSHGHHDNGGWGDLHGGGGDFGGSDGASHHHD